jgi:hypothetical protein
MKSGKDTLLLLARAGMEISWRYAWAVFLTLSITHRRFPLAEAAGALAMAAFLTRLTARRNWRVYQTLLLQLAGFVLSALLIGYRIWFEGLPFFSLTWIRDLFLNPKDLPQWTILMLILFCLLLVWQGGRTLVKAPKDYFSVCLQFDKGLGLFFLLLLVQFVLQEKAGIRIEDRAREFLIFAFFIFSLISIGLTRDRHDLQKSFLSGYHGVGVILSFSTVILMFGSGMTLLFYPYLTHMADSLQIVLKNVTEPMVPVIVKVLSFIFVPGRLRDEVMNSGAVEPDASAISASGDGGWAALLLKGLGWGVIGIIALMAVVILGYIMSYIAGRLFKKNIKEKGQPMSFAWLFKLLEELICMPLRIWDAFVHMLKGFDSAVPVYIGFLRWASRSGLAPISSETPTEYGNRVMQHFPNLKQEIEMIVEAFNREVYGLFVTDPKILAGILSARRRMRSPRHWPSRMKAWFFQ